jgi:dTMP kinase
VFITVEGIDGSGKSTITKLLTENLRQRGLPVTPTAEPGDIPIGTHIRELLSNFPFS